MAFGRRRRAHRSPSRRQTQSIVPLEGGKLLIPNAHDDLEKSCYDVKLLLDQYPLIDNSFAHANQAFAQGRLDEAIAAFRQTIALKPDFAEANSNLGFPGRRVRRAS